ncbi:unnamed protein product [Prorocentrum cordatum]|uniref:Uncharacterized protein n=1 Tax=Prorocentrum cordatum TaxID=2364126 RepID=A0ABN9TZH8_9DINO|nr:unnamed protein product [Polarella glacialis]
MRVRLFGVFLRDVLHALVDKDNEERLARDPDSEYRVLRPAPGGDPTLEDRDISFVYRAPWPFWDRDVLQRRWTFPLGGEGSGCVALVMRSFHDGLLLPEREDLLTA